MKIGDVVYNPEKNLIGVVEGHAAWCNGIVIGSLLFGLAIINIKSLWIKIGEL